MVELFDGVYKEKCVLITGDTGFKGSWLAYWLHKMGANVIGLSDGIPTQPNHFQLLKNKFQYQSYLGNINNTSDIDKVFSENKIDLVFHLAAQSLVRYSYNHPIETFKTNIIGTGNIIEFSGLNKQCKGIIVVSSDKCYLNREDDKPYNENDPMGGYDPYSASKACTEIITESMRSSFFNVKQHGKSHNFIVTSARAGNVIGGGDWAEDRLIPDLVKNIKLKKTTTIRNPNSTRPWQHVLEPISGYLMLGKLILQNNISVARAWNFGPENNMTLSVHEVLSIAKKNWDKLDYSFSNTENNMHESKFLRLDTNLALDELKWKPVWSINEAIEKTMNWYREYYEENRIISENQIEEYILDAKLKDLTWTK